MLGVLKAGAAYVPLEPSLPTARLEGMLDAASVSIVIVDGGGLSGASRTRATIIDLNADRDSIAAQSPENLSVRVHGENLAYVVFTSGSTGRPKGVMVSHRSLLAVAAAWEEVLRPAAAPLRHLQVAGFAFDVFTGDWVRALDHRRNSGRLSRLMSRSTRGPRRVSSSANASSASSSSRRSPSPWPRISSDRPTTWAASGCWPSAPTRSAAVFTRRLRSWWGPAAESSTPTV